MVEEAPSQDAKPEEAKPEEAKTDLIIISSRIKRELHGLGVNVTSDFVDAFNTFVVESCTKIAGRCKANGRKTVRPYDI